MRSLFYLAISAFAALAQAASPNPFNIPNGGYDFTAGKPVTITWEPTTEATITLKWQIQADGINADSGIIIATHIANTGSHTFTVPTSLIAGVEYTIEIIDDSDPDSINFTPNFTVDGATGTTTGTSAVPTSTDTESSADITTSTLTSSASTTSDASTSSDVSTSSDASTETTDSTSSTSSAEVSSTVSEEPTATDDEDSAEETDDSAPNPNGAASLKIPGGILSGVLVVMALL